MPGTLDDRVVADTILKLIDEFKKEYPNYDNKELESGEIRAVELKIRGHGKLKLSSHYVRRNWDDIANTAVPNPGLLYNMYQIEHIEKGVPPRCLIRVLVIPKSKRTEWSKWTKDDKIMSKLGEDYEIGTGVVRGFRADTQITYYNINMNNVVEVHNPRYRLPHTTLNTFLKFTCPIAQFDFPYYEFCNGHRTYENRMDRNTDSVSDKRNCYWIDLSSVIYDSQYIHAFEVLRLKNWYHQEYKNLMSHITKMVNDNPDINICQFLDDNFHVLAHNLIDNKPKLVQDLMYNHLTPEISAMCLGHSSTHMYQNEHTHAKVTFENEIFWHVYYVLYMCNRIVSPFIMRQDYELRVVPYDDAVVILSELEKYVYVQNNDIQHRAYNESVTSDAKFEALCKAGEVDL